MLGLASLLLLTAFDDAGAFVATPNVLRAATIRRNQGVPHPERIADATAPVDGDLWDTQWTTRFDKGGVLEWDLGSITHLELFRLQADNNDFYTLFASVDGEQWSKVWVARPVEIPGMQTRTSDPLDVNTRFLRLTAEGGDGLFSIGEFEIYDSPRSMAQAALKRITPPPPPPPAPVNTAHLLVIAVAFIGAYWLYRNRLDNLAAARTEPQAPAVDKK